ncbi:MAG: MFS transporter [Anaerolineae bacterium]|nr:MFS transporter [Anaerolineae bacterium]
MLPSYDSSVRAFGWPSTFRALRHRNYRLFWSGQTISQVGAWMQIVAQGWLVYRLTDSPLMLGLVNVVALLPVVPLSLLAGVISDRVPRRNVIFVTEIVLMLQALMMAALIWLNMIQIWHIVVLSFVLGAAAAVEQPARLAFVADVVGKEDLTNAVALNSSMYNSARIVGPAIAGLLLAWIGEAGCFFVNGVTYLAVIFALIAVQLPPQTVRKERLRVTDSLRGGLRYVWDSRTIRALMGIVAVSSFFTLPYIALMPVFARDILEAGPQGLGFLMTAVGIGAITGALGVANIQPGRRGKWLTWGNIMGPVFLLLFCLSGSFGVSLALVALVGASNAVRQTLANSLIQLTSADEYRGRVMSVFNLVFNGMSRVGALGVGAMAEVTSAPWALASGALVALIWGLVVIWSMPYVNRLP